MHRTRTDMFANVIAMSRRALIRGALAAGVALSFGAVAAQADEFVNALPDGGAMDGFRRRRLLRGRPCQGRCVAQVLTTRARRGCSVPQRTPPPSPPTRRPTSPRYNGWCSYAVSEGYGAEVDFVNGWSVLDGKLYLNWDAETRDAFMAEQSSRIEQAELNWPDLHAGLLDGSAAMYTHAAEGVDIAHPQQLD